MLFGNPKRILPTVVKVTVVATVLSGAIFILWPITTAKALILFLSLEGTGFLAGAFSASSQPPPQGTLAQRIATFFEPQRAVPVHYSPPLFYGGLLLLAISYIVAVLI